MIQEKNKEGMEKLESFLYNKLNNGKEEENNLKYIKTFRNKIESSHFFNEKKGALLGYFSAVNVIKKITEEKGDEITHIKLLDEIMRCISISLNDDDNDIIYAAAQCMYNIIIFFKSYKYVLNNFKDFFEGLLILVTNNDEDVIDIAKDLDCSLKGVINYSFQDIIPPEINLLEFFKEIILNIKRTNENNVEDKCTVVSWISCINQIPGIKLINILHLFLGDLFDMLKIKDEKLQKITNECLEGFYREIEDDFEETPYNIKIAIFKIVIEKCENNKKNEKNEEEETMKLKAFKWAILFLQQYKFLFIRIKQKLIQPKKKLTNVSSDTSLNKELSRKKDVKSKNEKSEKENNDENDEDDDNGKLPFDLISKFLTIIFDTLRDNQDIRSNSIKEKVGNTNNNIINNYTDIGKEKEKENEKDKYTNINNCNNSLLAIIEKYKMSTNNIKQLETVLMNYLNFENKELLFIVIKWIDKFFNKFGEDAFSNNFDGFLKEFTSIAIYKDEEIFEIGIKTLYNIEKCRKGSINAIINNVLEKLKEQDNCFAIKRTKEFVKALCRELNVKYVYSIFADVLKSMSSKSSMSRSDFVCKIINILNMLLLTSNDTEELRNLLKNIQNTKNKEDKLFFDKLFTTWCINPVSCLILCLIAEDFELSNHLLIKFGQLKSKLIQENYLEYAQLIQILETNAFISKKIYNIFYRYKTIFITA